MKLVPTKIKVGKNIIILAHNYPSGDPELSEDDLEITKRLVESGKILDIEVVNHNNIAKT